MHLHTRELQGELRSCFTHGTKKGAVLKVLAHMRWKDGSRRSTQSMIGDETRRKAGVRAAGALLPRGRDKTLKIEGGHPRVSREGIRKGRPNTFGHDRGRGNTEDGTIQQYKRSFKAEEY